MTDIFISYSRKDTHFVKALHEALIQLNRETWVDWQDILPGVDWMMAIEAAIEAANTFAFVISPHSVTSEVCGLEIAHAVAHNKRLIPIVRCEADAKAIPPALNALNWIFFREGDDFNLGLQKLIQAMDLDLEHVRTHTRLLVRANEWHRKQRDNSFLLRGSDLEDSEEWLSESTHRDPKPTELQTQYIVASQQAQRREAQQWKALYEEAQRERRRAEIAEAEALNALSQALLLAGDQLKALVASVKAVKLSRMTELPPELQRRIGLKLQQIVSGMQERNRIQGHQGDVIQVCFRPDGKALATASTDGTVKLWQADGSLLHTLEIEDITCICFSPDSRAIASANNQGTVQVWALKGQKLLSFQAHTAKITGLCFSPDGQTLASASVDSTIRLWGMYGNLINTLQGHQDWITSISFSQDGSILVSSSADKTVRLWQLDGTLIRQLTAHETWVTDASLSPDRQALASASADNTIKLWNLDRDPKILKGHTAWVTCIEFSPDGQTLASASIDHTIKLWHLSGKLIKTFRGHTAWVTSLSFSADGQTLASASADRTARLWHLGQELHTLRGHSAGITSIDISSQEILASSGTDRLINLWRLDGSLLKTFKTYSARVMNLRFSPDGQIIASASADGKIKLWNLEGALVRTLEGHFDVVNNISFSPTGQLLISGSRDGRRFTHSKFGKSQGASH